MGNSLAARSPSWDAEFRLIWMGSEGSGCEMFASFRAFTQPPAGPLLNIKKITPSYVHSELIATNTPPAKLYGFKMYH